MDDPDRSEAVASASSPLQDAAGLARAAAAFLALAIEPALLDDVAADLARLRQHAASVLEFRLDDACEIAPVFRP